MVANCTKVGFAQTKQSCSVKFRVPANIVVGVRVKLLSILVSPGFLGVILCFCVNRTRIPIVLLAWHVRPSLKQEDAFAARRELPGEGSPARARADDNEIIVFAVFIVTIRRRSSQFLTTRLAEHFSKHGVTREPGAQDYSRLRKPDLVSSWIVIR